MARRTPPNNRPWPDNLIYDFNLPSSTSPAEAETFISSLSTSEKNKEFMRLRYIEGKQFSEIAPMYGISPSAVRQGIKYARDKNMKNAGEADNDLLSFANVAAEDTAPAPAQDDGAEAAESVAEEAPAVQEPSTVQESSTVQEPPVVQEPPMESGNTAPVKIREELKPILTALATTTRQKTYVYDTKTRVVLSTDNVPRGLRHDARYIPLPDYFQIKEFDLMKAFAEAVSPEMGTVLQTALAGIGPFKAFRSTVKDFGLIEAWRDFRNQRFLEIATEWWDKNIEPALAARKDEIGPAAPTSEQRQVTPDGKLIVDPATLNGIALIETIRVLFRRVGPGDFEEALDELRDALCSLSCQPSEEQ